MSWRRRYHNAGKIKGNIISIRDFNQWPFVTSQEKAGRFGADQWKKCAPSSPRWAPADSSSAHQKTERNTSPRWLETEPKPGNPVQAWAIDHVKETVQLTSRRGSRQRAEAGRQARWGEESHRGKPWVFDPRVVSHPPRLPLTICSPGSHLSVSDKATTARSIAIASSPNNRNLQK